MRFITQDEMTLADGSARNQKKWQIPNEAT